MEGANGKRRKPVSFYLAIIFGIFLVFSVILNLILIVALAMQAFPEDEYASYKERFVCGERFTKDKILHILVTGAIISDKESYRKDNVRSVSMALKRAKNDKDIKAVLLHIDSPGGGITECEQIRGEILGFKESRPSVPIVVTMDRVAASGGYYIAAPADKIIAYPTTITGSIGVITYYVNIEGLLDKIGVRTLAIKSADKKDIGSPFRQLTEEEKGLYQEIINEMYQRFIKVIEEGRKNLKREEILHLADGRIYTGEQALKLGLIDDIGDFEYAIKVCKKLSGLTQAQVIEYKRPPSIFDWIFGSTRYNESSIMGELKKFALEKNNPQFLYMWSW
jgi:protease-4